jgi:hypothetical protein
VKDPLKYIEHFVKQRLSFLETTAANDWEVFEKKLKRALFFRRLKVYTSLTAVTLLFLWINQSLLLGPQPGNNSSNRPAFLAKPALLKAAVHSPKPLSPPLKIVKPKQKSANISSLATPKIQPLTTKAKPLFLPRRPLHRPRSSSLVAQNIKPRPLHLPKKQGAAVAQNLHLGQGFIASRQPNYVNTVWVKPKKQVYISPLQSKNPWSYAINVYPNFTFRKFQVNPDKVHLLHSDFVDEMQDNENRGFSLNIGFEVSRRIAPTTYLNSGLEYITNTYQANFNFSKFRESNVDPLTGEILNYQLTQNPEQIVFNDENQFHYLNLPISISHQPWANKHVRLNLEAGASLLYFLRAQGTTLDYSTLSVIDLSSQTYRKFMGSLSMKVGVQYWVSPQINIGFEPTFMYFTNTIYTNNHPFDAIPYSVGLNLNLQVKLN